MNISIPYLINGAEKKINHCEGRGILSVFFKIKQRIQSKYIVGQVFNAEEKYGHRQVFQINCYTF